MKFGEDSGANTGNRKSISYKCEGMNDFVRAVSVESLNLVIYINITARNTCHDSFMRIIVLACQYKRSCKMSPDIKRSCESHQSNQ